ncbi:MAG TPA: SPOR domain-containing protein [Sulfuriferula sp.]|nr:SPOR domain-containing protein [Sulfuriferula sp.]
MARDYKSRPSEQKKGGSLLSGILIGLLIGLASAIAIALWVSKSNPFTTREKPAASESKGKTATNPPATTPPAEEKPRFDFYKILPGNEAAMTDQDLHRNPTPPAGESYYLQAGAFPNSADADNLKARLALLGYEASIQTAEIPGKGIWHRVRVGPFNSMDELNKTRTALEQNQIKTHLVRIKNATTNTQSNPTP